MASTLASVWLVLPVPMKAGQKCRTVYSHGRNRSADSKTPGFAPLFSGPSPCADFACIWPCGWLLYIIASSIRPCPQAHQWPGRPMPERRSSGHVFHQGLHHRIVTFCSSTNVLVHGSLTGSIKHAGLDEFLWQTHAKNWRAGKLFPSRMVVGFSAWRRTQDLPISLPVAGNRFWLASAQLGRPDPLRR